MPSAKRLRSYGHSATERPIFPETIYEPKPCCVIWLIWRQTIKVSIGLFHKSSSQKQTPIPHVGQDRPKSSGSRATRYSCSAESHPGTRYEIGHLTRSRDISSASTELKFWKGTGKLKAFTEPVGDGETAFDPKIDVRAR